ncbi:hypothetical protein Q2T76_00830 [Lactobacillus sp. YT155]|uniref:hypothetical protein n=1 Tax=Lactobacillus sp. YT155 TaxID=3060955 RepID=UPI00265D7892|nr:hypothetical protein [Lactobacillus sp. YT155]MDO1604593.1 hypothetical protein [Lactobacillus sp. YT155]
MKRLTKWIISLAVLLCVFPNNYMLLQAKGTDVTTHVANSSKKQSATIDKNKQATTDDTGFQDTETAFVFENRAKLTLSVSKSGSATSTSVGDKVHVDVTIESYTNGDMTGHENSSMIIPYPNEVQGFKITTPGTLQASGTNNMKLVPMGGNDLSTVLLFYEAIKGIPLGSTDGFATQFNNIPTSKQAIFENLKKSGDKVTASYDSEITPDAVGKDSFTIASGFYDSANGGQFTDDLSVNLPGNKITDWNLTLDNPELSMTVDPKNSSTLINAASGNWSNYSGSKTATMQYQVDNGAKQTIASSDIDQTNKKFSTKFDLSKSDQTIDKDGDHIVKFFTTIDGIVQEADLTVHVTIKKATTPPVLKLNPAEVQVDETSNGQYTLNVKGTFNDIDSSKVTIFGTYADNSNVGLTNNTFDNTNQGKDNDFSLSFTTPAGKLVPGTNRLVFWAKDPDGNISQKVDFNVTVNPVAANEPPTFTLDSTSILLDSKTSGTYDFVLAGKFTDKDSDSVKFTSTFKDNTTTTSDSFDNTTKGSPVPFKINMSVPVDKLNNGNNSMTVVATDSDGGKSSVITVKFTMQTSELKFATVASNSSFNDGILASGTGYSYHAKDWQVDVSDTVTKPGATPTWKLQATQDQAFIDSTTNKQLSTNMRYKNQAGNYISLSVGKPVDVDMVKSSDDETLYQLGWTSLDGFQLPFRSYEHTGNYQSKVTWTLVDAP